MSAPDLALRSRRVVTPAGIIPATVEVRAGRIHALRAHDDPPADIPLVDCGDDALLPGLVDTHVHVNEPGRTEWEGFRTATRAAAAGGVTTLLDMPLNSVPATTSLEALAAKGAAAAGQLWVDVGLLGGVVPGNARALRSLWEAGVLAFKCFLAPSGVDEFGHVGDAELRLALPELAALGAVLMAHAEHPPVLEAAAREVAASGMPARRYETYLRSRPPAAETDAIALLLALAEAHQARIHIVHLAAAHALPRLARARAAGLGVTVECCPHYLHFDAEQIADGATEFKCAPPIRDRANREALWRGLADGTIDMIVSDHSPCPPEMKRRAEGDFLGAWGGIASLQLGLSVIWSEARARGFTLAHVAEWMCHAPARLVGLANRVGAIAPGRDAHLVVFAPEEEYVVDAERLEHRHKLTPYAGRRLAGVVRATYLRGERVYDHGAVAPTPTGRLITRTNP